MVLSLSFSVEERNDNKIITVTDSTGVYDALTNTGGWGAPNPEVTDIDGSNHTLEMIITITTSDNVEVEYDPIDLFTEFGPFTTTADLVFELDCSMLLIGTEALGTTDTEFPDGIYEVVYIYDRGLGSEVSTTVNLLIEGQSRNSVYNLLREVPTIYNCSDCRSRVILDTLLSKAFLDAIRASAYVAQEENLLKDLAVLERLVIDGSNYNW